MFLGIVLKTAKRLIILPEYLYKRPQKSFRLYEIEKKSNKMHIGRQAKENSVISCKKIFLEDNSENSNEISLSLLSICYSKSIVVPRFPGYNDAAFLFIFEITTFYQYWLFYIYDTLLNEYNA